MREYITEIEIEIKGPERSEPGWAESTDFCRVYA